MVIEIAQFRAQPGKAEELQAGLLRGLEVIRRAEGCRSGVLRRCVEDSNLFHYEIAWETLEDHTVKFRGGPLLGEYRAHIAGLFVEPATANHFEQVGAG
jgi:quinol monooxygenase YgiN